MFDWIPYLFHLMDTVTPTWYVTAIVLGCCTIVGAGVTYKKWEHDYDAILPTFLTILIGGLVSGLWPLVLIALPFVGCLAAMFYVGYQLAERYEKRP